jgi:orotidine-5'-phosphate decarboxylase
VKAPAPASGFAGRLAAAWTAANSLVCVGLDPEPKKFPDRFRDAPGGIFEFNKAIIDATRDLVCAYKPQFAHYAAHGAENQLEHTIHYIKATAPNAIVILDSKRGDIGSTAEQYAHEAFERYGADAVTVNPYLGRDSVEPFLARADKGVIILCRTSNPGAKDFQDLNVGPGKKLFQHVAESVAQDWNGAGNCMIVVGATYPDELAELRKRTGDLPFLVPGVGAQGGDVAKVMAAGKTAAGTGLVISSSRAILYASSGPDFAEAARRAAVELRDSINAHRQPALR